MRIRFMALCVDRRLEPETVFQTVRETIAVSGNPPDEYRVDYRGGLIKTLALRGSAYAGKLPKGGKFRYIAAPATSTLSILRCGPVRRALRRLIPPAGMYVRNRPRWRSNWTELRPGQRRVVFWWLAGLGLGGPVVAAAGWILCYFAVIVGFGFWLSVTGH